ncbi:hypothetical protein BDQ17DRAFT_1247578 [Cyathus striatus]|nr:hypothetical protein BDQ17DRAFT_1247578 [Cyathus striatus]
MLSNGTFAVAIIKRQVVIVQAARTHSKREKYLDVQTFAPFGERVFLASDVPHARVASSDILTILPLGDKSHITDNQGILELPQQSFSKFVELSTRQQKRCESLWKSWISRRF